MRAVVVAVNDDGTCCQALNRWREEHKLPGLVDAHGYALASAEGTNPPFLSILGDFWQSAEDFAAFCGRINDDTAIVFCLDSEVAGRRGEQVLADLLRDFRHPAWWGCVLTGGTSPEKIDNYVGSLARERHIEEGTVRAHYIGAGYNWVEGVKDIVGELSLRLSEDIGWAGWAPRLFARRVETIGAAIHNLRNMPCRLDVVTVEDIARRSKASSKPEWSEEFSRICEGAWQASFGKDSRDQMAALGQLKVAVAGVTPEAVGPVLRSSNCKLALEGAEKRLAGIASMAVKPNAWNTSSACDLAKWLDETVGVVEAVISVLDGIRKPSDPQGKAS